MPEAGLNSKSENIAIRWRTLAERRRDYLAQLHQSGRWRRHFTEEALVAQIRGTLQAIELWDKAASAARENALDHALQAIDRPGVIWR